jgi:hypothetical protein
MPITFALEDVLSRGAPLDGAIAAMLGARH